MEMTYNYITYDKIYGLVNYGETTLDTDDTTTWWITKERCKDCGGAWLAENYLNGHSACPFCGSGHLLHIQLFHTLTVDLTTLKEVECDIGIPKPAQYYCDGLADYKELVEAFGEEKEGIVVKDKYGERVKIKSPEYFRLHKMKRNGNLTTAAALELIVTGEDEEFLSYFAEFKPFFSEVRIQYNKKLEKVIEIQQETYRWKATYPYASRKEFAEWAKKQKYSSYYFLAYENRLWEELTEVKADVRALMRFLKWEDKE